MDDPNDFFGDVFQDPEDDPLLGGDAPDDEPAEGDSPPSRGDAPSPGTPSWMTDELDSQRADAPAPTDSPNDPPPGDGDSGKASDPRRREIVVDQRAGRGLDALNEAVAQGWRLIRISLAQADESAGERRAAERFVAILEPDSPQSLFDFGPGS